MQHAAANAYARAAQTGQSPRELEASLLIKSASRLQVIRDGWHNGTQDLGDALMYNRKIWTVLATSATEPTNPLPSDIKRNIAQLAAIIFTRTIAILADPAPEKLTLLIQINGNIAAGLRARPLAASTVPLTPAA